MTTQTIDYGIDLGTTNSAIAKFDAGSVEVFKNPTGQKETLPSVVGFRKDRILIGDKAREYLSIDPRSVVGGFKRKMGTAETLQIESLASSKTPVELSAFVLKELRSFVESHNGEVITSAVITIPASFDTAQSNATKQAGEFAGLRQVVLLQEPIAASLAYANKRRKSLEPGCWLVYDFGGGTFDVALVRCEKDGQLTVVDHEGDNFLGGSDIDQVIVEQLLAPALQKAGEFHDLISNLKSHSGRWHGLWESLLLRAEAAKIELSHAHSTELDIRTKDDAGTDVDLVVEVTRSQLDAVSLPIIDRTVALVRRILTRNNILPRDLQFMLMVGGATLMPTLRTRVGECVGTPVKTDIDPTTAIAVGAAYFASRQPRETSRNPDSNDMPAQGVQLKVVYERSSRAKEELFVAKVTGGIEGHTYRIRRDDGGYDSGVKILQERIAEDLPLVPDAYNAFSIEVYDHTHARVACSVEQITISHGAYSVAGQLLPHDICLQIDDAETGMARLDAICSRGSLLPTRSRRSYIANRTVLRGAESSVLQFVVHEGDADEPPESTRTLGVLSLSGRQLTRDLPKGTDLEVRLEISESRDLTFRVYVVATDQEFTEVFVPTAREVPVHVLLRDSRRLLEAIQAEMSEATQAGRYEVAGQCKGLLGRASAVESAASLLTPDDCTTDRYKLEDEKRRCASELASLTKGKRYEVARRKYEEARKRCEDAVADGGTDRERRLLRELLQREQYAIDSLKPARVDALREEVVALTISVRRRDPAFLQMHFDRCVSLMPSMNDSVQAQSLVESGRSAIAEGRWQQLDDLIVKLYSLTPNQNGEMAGFTGIVR